MSSELTSPAPAAAHLCPQCDAPLRRRARRCGGCGAKVAGRQPLDRLEAGLAAAIVILLGVGVGGAILDDSGSSTNADRLTLLPPGGTAGGPRGAITTTIKTHWALRQQGDSASLDRAYAVFTGAAARNISHGDWVAQAKAAGGLQARVSKVWITSLRRNSAGATAKVRTMSAGAGCQVWMIRYSLRRDSLGWRISNLTEGAKPCLPGS